MIRSRIATVVISVLAFSMSSNAAVLNPDQAWERVASTQQMRKINGSQQHAQLLYTNYAQSQPTSYIFKIAGSDGYVLVSADDAVAPLLGYSDNEFDADNMPDALRYWFDEYGRQIQWARDNGKEYAVPMMAQRAAIAPMTTTRWNQDAPYNDLCPSYLGKKCVTGCVATAASQAMKYYNWPDTGVGEITYTSRSINKTLSMDFSEVDFDWDNMLNQYGPTATDAEKQAVATLMQAVGYSVKMDYTPNESSAAVSDLAIALANNFKYDKGLQLQMRDLYGIDDWNDLVYDQLVHYGPVIYGGQSNQGGHCFVCDGYSSDGYFHFNWGWGGMSDGYFLLTALNPDSQGIGGTASAYNFYQQIISNLCKQGQGSGQVVKQFYTSTFEMPETATLGRVLTVQIPVTNYSIEPISGKLGFKIVSSSGAVTYAEGSTFSDFKTMNTASSWQAIFKSLDNGTYTVTPAWCDTESDTWYPVDVCISAPQSYTMSVSGSTATFTPNGECNLSVSDFSITPLYTNSKFSISAKITNNGSNEAYQYLVPIFVQNDNVVMQGDMALLDLQAGETLDFEYFSSLLVPKGQGQVQAGTYDLYLISVGGLTIYYYGQVEVNDGESTSVSFGQLYFPDGNTESVDASNMKLEASIECTSGYFADAVMAYIFPNVSGNVESVGSLSSQPVFLNAGDQDTLKFTGSFEGTVGDSYFATIRFNNKFVNSTTVIFTLGESGICDVRVVDNQDIEFYSINGIRIDGNSLAPGIYLMRQGSTVRKMVIR